MRLTVQLQHFGREHLNGNKGASYFNFINHFIQSGYIPWNDGDHRRKFFEIIGSFVDERNRLIENKKISFWGEWEAPSSFTQVNNPPNFHPKYIHHRLFAHDPVSYQNNLQVIVPNMPNGFVYSLPIALQNTDPYVFGKHFIYSNCHQRGRLRFLEPGSVILFGSRVDHRFVLDTVFVVAESIDYNLGKDELFFQRLINDGWISETFYNVTIKTLQQYPGTDLKNPLTLYRGATYNKPIDGMYSYFPCSSKGSFMRPDINGIDINPRLLMGTKYLKTPPKDAWDYVASQVRDNKLQLGVYAEEPLVQIP